MLSRIDIENELGKGINIHPLNLDNIRENFIDLTVSRFAWSLGAGLIKHTGTAKFEFSASRVDTYSQEKGKSCCVTVTEGGKDIRYILVLPHSQTIVETEEVVAVDWYIGGSLHSKVDIVSRGIGAFSTLLGPRFSGHFMLALHNTTENIIAIPVGSKIAALAFFYLNSPISNTASAATSGHVSKFAELGIICDSSVRTILEESWKTNIVGVRDHMVESETYKTLCERKARAKTHWVKSVFSKENMIKVLVTIGLFAFLGIIAYSVDKYTGNTEWFDKFINVGCSGIFVTIIAAIWKSLPKK